MDDVVPGAGVVRALLREQVPRLAGLPLRPSELQGSSNVVYRLGYDLAVRLPRSADYVDGLLTETAWLPRVSAAVSTTVPEVVFAGQPSPTFPRPWTVVSWIAGERPGHLEPAQQRALAEDLGRFARELHSVRTDGIAAGAERWGYRCGEPVTDQIDAWLEIAAVGLADLFNPTAVREAWRLVRDVPPASSEPCWVHTDLSAENLLVHPDGHLAGVVDFGGMGVGDPAIDLAYGWSLFDDDGLMALRAAADADDATWVRSRAFAFVGPGLLSLLDYRQSMPERAARLLRMVHAIAADVGVDLDPR